MDPVTVAGLTASIIQIITATAQTIQFLNDVQDAPKDRAKIVKEAANLLGLLTSLQYRMEEANLKDAWYGRLLSLGGDGGPLDQYKHALETLAGRLKPKSGIKEFQRRLIWTLDKKHIKETLDEIERLKTLIVLALQEDNFELSLSIKQEIGTVGQEVVGISQAVAEMNIIQELNHERHLDGECQAAISWLSPLNFCAKQNDTFNRRQNGTGRWLLEAEEFKFWLSGDKQSFWCPGLPGAGKTILTSIVIDYLERTFSPRDTAVIYIYNSYTEHAEQSATNLIGSLLQQIVRQKPVVSEGIKTMYRQHSAQGTRPSLGDLSSSLRLETKDFAHVFIVVDALDECDEANGVRESLLEKLRGQLVERNIRLMITSRFLTGLEYDLNGAIFLEIRAFDDDIEGYLRCRIPKERRLAPHVASDEDLHDAIIDTIVNNAQGMFLLAQFHLDSLAKKHNKRDIRLALYSLPKELNGMYDEAMHRIYSQPTEDVALAKRVLSWVSCAKRPLKVLWLQHALAVEPGAMEIDEEALTEEDLLVSVCAGLVTIEKESNIIRLAHFTTQEYLERTRINHFPTAEIDIAVSCLTYLSFDGYIELAYTRSKRNPSRDQYPLLSYVTTYWAAHTRGEPEKDPQIQRLALQLFENKRKEVSLNSIKQSSRSRRGAHPYSKPVVEGLSLAASSGLITITAMFLDKGAQIENPSFPNGERPLHLAARYGYGAVVKLLLEKGAQRDARIWKSKETALMLAAGSGHELVVKVLLDSGAAIEAENSEKSTPLKFAVSFHNTAVAALLLESGADINTKDAHGLTPITIASRKRNSIDMMKLLLGRGADLSTRSVHNRTLLGDAAYISSSDVVRLLLEAGADVNARDGLDNGTALFSAMFSGKSDKVQLLLDAGIDRHARNDEGKTALFRGRSVDAIRLMLDAGSDVNAVDRYGTTTLMAAACRSDAAVVQFLIKAGAEVNVKDNNEQTALSMAAGGSTLAVMQQLIDAGADVNAKNRRGRTALSMAVEKGDAAAVQLLLEGGAGVNMKDNDGKTALLAAAKEGCAAIVQLLLEAEADMNAKGDYGATALLVAADKGHGAVVALLLEKGADVNTKRDYGATALLLATRKGHAATVQLLLEKGAEVYKKVKR